MNPWILAARPKTLTASFIPVLVGTALAPQVNWLLAFCCLFFALFVQIATNLINDAIDFKKGADTKERIGPVRVVQSGMLTPASVMKGAAACLALAACLAVPLVLKGGVLIPALLCLCLLLAYMYTGGPYPLAYLGLGEVFVFIFFGVVATGGSFYIQTLEATWKAVIASVQIGLLSTLLIAVNNVRDFAADSVANKRTIVVRYGVNFGKSVITFCAFTPFFLTLFWIHHHFMAAFLPWLVLPLAISVNLKVWQLPPGPEYNQLLGMGALLHLAFGILMAIGLVV